MELAVLVLLSLIFLFNLVSIVLLLLLGSALVQLIDKTKARPQEPVKEVEKPWWENM